MRRVRVTIVAVGKAINIINTEHISEVHKV